MNVNVLSSELCQAAEELGTDEDHVIQAGSKQVSKSHMILSDGSISLTLTIIGLRTGQAD